MKKLLRFVLVITLLLVIAVFSMIKPLDTTPYQQTAFYHHEIAAIDSVLSVTSTSTNAGHDTVEVGWARVNLLPPFTTPIAIDAHRGGKHFEGVHDSIHVRAFVFKQGETKIAYISADLLIIPPSVSKMFDSMMMNEGYTSANVFFTATHTHTSIGSWYGSYVGKKFAGQYDERIPKHIASCISKAIIEAEKNLSPAKIGYGGFPTQNLVYNRLVRDMAHLPDSLGTIDSTLRIVKFEKTTGDKAAIITFAAHCTVFHEEMMRISGDWAGMMMERLDTSGKINFSSFSAGAVGSHGPCEVSKEQETEAGYMANGVANVVLQNFDSIETAYVTSLNILTAPLYLREPNLRITDKFTLRPWLFYRLFGNEAVNISLLRIGNIFFAGTPCDFSGELVSEIESAATEKSRHLLITSFNGGYIGYITHDKWYALNTYETRLMNWFGPENGAYLSEAIKKMLE